MWCLLGLYCLHAGELVFDSTQLRTRFATIVSALGGPKHFTNGKVSPFPVTGWRRQSIEAALNDMPVLGKGHFLDLASEVRGRLGDRDWRSAAALALLLAGRVGENGPSWNGKGNMGGYFPSLEPPKSYTGPWPLIRHKTGRVSLAPCEAVQMELFSFFDERSIHNWFARYDRP